jgi:hypothetical protein
MDMTNKRNKLCLHFFVLKIASIVILWTFELMFNNFQVIQNVCLLEMYISLELLSETDTAAFCHPY